MSPSPPVSRRTFVRPGARAQGIEPAWCFRFVGPGTAHNTTPDTLFLDVGGSPGPGVIDQHDGVEHGLCTSDILFRHPEWVYDHLLPPVSAGAGVAMQPRRSLEIVTHILPDFDAVGSSWLAMRLVEDGAFPAGSEGFVAYSSAVDQGRIPIDSCLEGEEVVAAHLAFLAFQNQVASSELDPRERDELLIREGHALVSATLASVNGARATPATTTSDFLAGAPGAGGWRQNPRFAAMREAADADRAFFQQDRAAALIVRDARLPVQGGPPDGCVQVPAFIAMGPLRSSLAKYWVRASGFPLFLAPFGRIDERGFHVHRVIISLDPTYTTAEGLSPSLRGLGLHLEALETRARTAAGGDDRPGPPRYPDGQCTNADPWYDGRGHHHTIIDTPRSGTVLQYEDIIDATLHPERWNST